MQPNPDLKIGTIVQIDPAHPHFPGDFLIVKAVGEKYVEGYLALVYAENHQPARYKGVAYLITTWENIQPVGEVEWLLEHKNEDEMGYQSDSANACQDDRSK